VRRAKRASLFQMMGPFLRKRTWYAVRRLTGIRLSPRINYLDWWMIAADFPAPVDRVRQALPSVGLSPVEIAPGTTTVCLMARENRRLDPGLPYGEVGVMVPVVHPPTSALPGYWVLHMPVTTDEALWSGREIFAVPKSLAEISFGLATDRRSARVSIGGRHVLTLEVEEQPTRPYSGDTYYYAMRGGKVLRAREAVRGEAGLAEGRGARYILGDHPIADAVRRLGLGMEAVSSRYAPHMESFLEPPVVQPRP